jgi:hypothetical protein
MSGRHQPGGAEPLLGVAALVIDDRGEERSVPGVELADRACGVQSPEPVHVDHDRPVVGLELPERSHQPRAGDRLHARTSDGGQFRAHRGHQIVAVGGEVGVAGRASVNGEPLVSGRAARLAVP